MRTWLSYRPKNGTLTYSYHEEHMATLGSVVQHSSNKWVAFTNVGSQVFEGEDAFERAKKFVERVSS